MAATEATEPQLTESDVARIETDLDFAVWNDTKLPDLVAVAALIRDWRAMRAALSKCDEIAVEAVQNNAALREQLAQAHNDNERLARVVQGIEEREAAVCPEDVGFDEYIRTLERRLKTRPQAGCPWTGNEP